MATYAVIDATGAVINTVKLDDPSAWTPPDGTTLVQSDVAGIGWTCADGVFTAPPEPAPTPEQAAAALAISAQSALAITDNVFIRCGKAGVAWPADWQSYVLALRAIVANPASATALPTAPAYPAGT